MTQEALKLALEALEGFYEYGYDRRECFEHITAIKEALAQPKQEPVAYLCENAVGHKYFRWKKPSSTYKPIALYTTPPQRTWVGLTDEELSEVYNQADWDTVNGWEYERAIEARLKEKNT
jgi:hypothetical protein